eukprot:5411655-Alexandrium_andersonii.AAC.1
MSASLVGSEMCIRDSSKRVLLGPGLSSAVGLLTDMSGCLRCLEIAGGFSCLLYTSDAADDM